MQTGMKNGYHTFFEGGKEVDVHVRVMVKKLGCRFPATGLFITSTESRRTTALRISSPLDEGIHGRLHGNFPDAGFRCGNDSHWAMNCYAKKDYAGNVIDDIYLK